MARFDVYTNRGGAGFLLDVQADLITRLNTRVVVPLLPRDTAPTPADRLNPVFEVQGSKVYMATQFMAAVPQSELTTLIATLDRESDAIFSAIDFLHHGW
ncbi:MAG TPA: CcdB family protein [Rubrivivax sp.]|nr:CcdB family protein [Rubrivivax sp.]